MFLRKQCRFGFCQLIYIPSGLRGGSSFRAGMCLRQQTHIDQFVDWVKEREDSRPYFACIHDADIHNPEVFFTYDSTDMNWLQKEIEAAEDVLDQLPKNYYGGVTHDLSLRYSDNMIRYLFEQMEKNHMLEDTYVVICADHGFSFSGNPIRDSFVTNLYLENYNCKQSYHAQVIRCLRYDPKRAVCTAKNTGKKGGK